jgi:uncharacterized protein with ParB-like and HNH nuclease domain
MNENEGAITRIDANAKNVTELLKDKKYEIDFYQREYRWETRHIEELITDLTDRFFESYQDTHTRKDDGPRYAHYFLGPIILSKRNGKTFIVDGQQRLTSLTLLLIYLKHLQKEFGIQNSVKLDDHICSEVRGTYSFNLDVADRQDAIEALFNDGTYEPINGEESTRNIVNRYSEIDTIIPPDIKNEHAILLFTDWLLLNVDLIEIVAFSDEEAYTIFETMNDRGLNLTQTEMLKGYLIANLSQETNKNKANELWKKQLAKLVKIHRNEEGDFFKHWLRAKYAESVRSGGRGETNQDFEKIGTEFHKWVRDKKDMIRLNTSTDYEVFINEKFLKFSNLYQSIRKYSLEYTPGFEAIYYNAYNNFTWQYPMLLAPVRDNDTREVAEQKIMLVARYIDHYIAHRAVNYLTLSYASQRTAVANFIFEIRDLAYDELKTQIQIKAQDIGHYFDGADERNRQGVMQFGLNQWSKRYIRYILARLTSFVETQSNQSDKFVEYTSTKIKRPYEIEHIWAAKYDRHKDEFSNEHAFFEKRNQIGGLILVPRGFNQSYNALPYEEKLPLYLQQNLLAQSLNQQAYHNNPDFISFLRKSGLPFEPHPQFRKEDIDKRTQLYKQLCEQVWSLETLLHEEDDANA